MSALQSDARLCADELYLAPGGCTLRLRSNSEALLADLADYFSPVASAAQTPDIDIIAIERDAPELDIDFLDWKCEPGKTGHNDAYADLPGGRLVRKARSGMVFLQSEKRRVAAGPCLKYDKQLITFINAQYMNWLQKQGWLTCHAAGIVYRDKGLGIAGFSGADKLTLMRHLLDSEEVSCLANDRLFIHGDTKDILGRGMPQLPRINQARGAGRMIEEAPMGAFLILDWQADSDRELEVQQVDLAEHRDLLGAVMKSPGPFYQYPDGSFLQDTTAINKSPYLLALENIPVYVARGRIDFSALSDRCLHELLA